MENETDNIIESQNDEEELELDLSEEEETNEEAEEATEEKPKETPEAKKARWERQYKQLSKKLGYEKTEEPKNAPSKSKSGELDYGQKAYLIASGIKGDEVSLVKEEMKKSGYDLDEVIDNPYFQQKLKDFRDAKIASDAIPKGTKRANTSQKDSVDYWLAKPFEEVPSDMKRKVLDARLKREEKGGMFSETPIVFG